MWLLFVFLVQPALSIYWGKVLLAVKTITLKQNSTYWRQLGKERRSGFLYGEIDEMDGIPLLHYVRLFGCVLMMGQTIYIVHLSMRIFIKDFMKETHTGEENIFQLVDMPKLAQKNLIKEKEKKKGDMVSKKSKKILVPKKKHSRKASPKKKKMMTVVTEPPPKEERKEPDDMFTAVEGEESRKPFSSVKPRRKHPKVPTKSVEQQSQRLPRAKKGHQREFLEEMEDFLVGDEAVEIEEKVRGKEPEKEDNSAKLTGSVTRMKLPTDKPPTRTQEKISFNKETNPGKRSDID